MFVGAVAPSRFLPLVDIIVNVFPTVDHLPLLARHLQFDQLQSPGVHFSLTFKSDLLVM